MVLRRIATYVALVALCTVPSSRITKVSAPLTPAEAIGRLRALPLAFEENRGQTAASARFVARGQGYAMWATDEGPMLRLGVEKATTIRMRAVDAALRVPAAEQPVDGRANYFIGNEPSRWITNVRRFGALRYANAYAGIDLVLHGTQQSLEYDFEVAPGVDPSIVAVAFDGVDDVRLEHDGDLTLVANGAELRFHKPIAYQDTEGGRRQIAARYALASSGEVRFDIGEYDRSRRLVIDPVIDYSTYLGGFTQGNGLTPTRDEAFAVAVDALGHAYLTGFTSAIDFPAAGAQFDPSCGGCLASGGDAFVAKIDPSASGAASLLFTTYLGSPGALSSGANAIAVDANGAVHVTGWTNAYNTPATPTDDSFPVTATAFQPADGGDQAVLDAFLTKLDASGSSLLYSTYIGGTNIDEGYGIHVDAGGLTYVAGRSASAEITAIKDLNNGFRNTNTAPGLTDAFVITVDTTASGLASLVYGTWFGGTGSDNIESLAVDSQGRAYIAGDTNGSKTTLPIVNGFQPTTTDGQHAFMAMFDPSVPGTGSLIYSTFIGDSGTQGASFREGGIGVDANGIVYMAGSTFGGTFATTPGAWKSTVEGADAFVVKIDPSQAGPASLVAATLLGGSFNDFPGALAIDPGGHPVVTGWTQSPNYPITPCGMPKVSGVDVFVTVLSKDLNGLVYSSVIGGAGSDWGFAVAVGPGASIYLAGVTESTNFPVANAFDPTHTTGGTREAFVTKISSPYDRCPKVPVAAGSIETTPEDTPKTIALNAADAGWTASTPDVLTWTVIEAPQHGGLDALTGTMTHQGASAYSANVTYTPAPNYFGPDSFTFKVNDGSADSNVATVTIDVTPVNDAPVAMPDFASTDDATSVVVPVLANDIDPDGDPLSLGSTLTCAHGTPSANPDATVLYAPAPGFAGNDTCEYVALDPLNAAAVGTIAIEVTPSNHPPSITAPPDQLTQEGETVNVAIVAGDPDGDVLTITAEGLPEGLAAQDAAIVGAPAPGSAGSYVVELTVDDGHGHTASVTFAWVVVPPIVLNQPPVCAAAAPSPTSLWPPNLQLVPIAILGVSDPDGDPTTIRITTIWQDEPTKTMGNPNTWIDGFGIDTPTAIVRAERGGTPTHASDGRVYEIRFEAKDPFGASCSGKVFVGVPKDPDIGPAIDSGVRYDSTVAGGQPLPIQ